MSSVARRDVNAIRTHTLIEQSDSAVVRFGDKYSRLRRRWVAGAFDRRVRGRGADGGAA